jgi:hypothetical protein
MTTSTAITTIFHTTLERAFKTPMLCDVTRIHTGHWVTPRVTHCADDATWGQVGGSRRIFMARTPLFKGGEASIDRVLERRENAYWKIEITDFKTWSMGFTKFQGEWTTEAIAEKQVRVCYRYTMYSDSVLLHPFHWFFTKVIWRGYMRQALEHVRQLAMDEAPYLQR